MANKKRKNGYIIYRLFNPGYIYSTESDREVYQEPYWTPIQGFNIKFPFTKNELISYLVFHSDIFNNLQNNFYIEKRGYLQSYGNFVYTISYRKRNKEYLPDIEKIKETVILLKDKIEENRRKHYQNLINKRKDIPYKFRYDPVPNLFRRKWHSPKYQGHSGLRSTVAFNTDPDYLDFVDSDYLPFSERIRKWSFDLFGTDGIKNWKSQYKVRKQYKIHLKKHFDSLQFEKRKFCFETD